MNRLVDSWRGDDWIDRLVEFGIATQTEVA
jgi:hypothetical protein